MILNIKSDSYNDCGAGIRARRLYQYRKTELRIVRLGNVQGTIRVLVPARHTLIQSNPVQSSPLSIATYTRRVWKIRQAARPTMGLKLTRPLGA